MTSPTDHIHEAAIFAENVRRELRAHPAEFVADLTDGLESDIVASLSDGAVLPSIENYANDLLRGAGLEPLLRSDDSNKKLTQFVEIFIPIVNKVREWTVGLAPAWWVFRAWVVAQLIGWLLFHDQTSSPGYLEWRNMQWGGVVVLGVMLYLSVRIGRADTTKWKTVLSISHVVLAVAGLAFMFVSPRGESTYFVYDNPSLGQTQCEQVQAPSVVGLSVANAKEVLYAFGMDRYFFDQDAMIELADVPDDVIVVQQVPQGGVPTCGVDAVQLIVDLSRLITTSTAVETTTTVRPQELNTTTTVQPKATTTTKP